MSDLPPSETKAAKVPLVIDTRTFIVAWMMVSSFILVVLCWWKPPAADNQIINTLVGVYVSTGFVTSLQWWMGSSKGSEDKTNIMAGGK